MRRKRRAQRAWRKERELILKTIVKKKGEFDWRLTRARARWGGNANRGDRVGGGNSEESNRAGEIKWRDAGAVVRVGGAETYTDEHISS